MSGEWKGWQTWQAFEKAGIVEKSLDFSDEDIIIDHAVGRTKNAVGKCWPMDAAVAYTLMKVGPNKALTWDEMVNHNTRMAAAMMSGKVGYGTVPDPRLESCGHDEVQAMYYTLGTPSINQHGYLTFKSKSWSHNGSMVTWLQKKGAPVEVKALATIRVKNHTAPTVEQFLASEHFAPLREFLKAKLAVESLSIYGPPSKRIPDLHVEHTLGECGFEQGKPCAHHSATELKNTWAMLRDSDGNFKTVWQRERTNKYWNRDMFGNGFHSLQAKNIVLWDEVKRGMANVIEEKVVLKYIKESLRRMLNRNDNIVTKEGKGKGSTHKWSDWGWLAEMSAYVKNTNSKKRKEGEVANGWVYTKVNSRHSYGHEIADFQWFPKEAPVEYMVARKEVGDWSDRTILTNLRFRSAEDAKAFIVSIMAAHADNNGFFQSRKHFGMEKKESDTEWKVKKTTVRLIMLGVVDPEDYMSPQEVVNMWRMGAPAVLAEHEDKFVRTPDYKVKQGEVNATE